jgi:hypothetical protein
MVWRGRTLNMAFVHGETAAFAVASASATFCTWRICAVPMLLRRRVWWVACTSGLLGCRVSMFADVPSFSPLQIQLRVPQLFSVVSSRLSNTLVRVFVYIAKRNMSTHDTRGRRTQSYNRIPHAHHPSPEHPPASSISAQTSLRLRDHQQIQGPYADRVYAPC